MSGAREEILGRIRSALADVPAAERPDDVPVAREYRRQGELSGEELIQRFAERVRDYHADVRRVAAGDVPGGEVAAGEVSAGAVSAAVTEACAELGLRRVVVPPALRAEWRPHADGITVVEDGGLTAHQLDEIDGAVTGCALAVAETGTLILDGQGESGRRLVTLVPDHFICIVAAEQIVGIVPEAVAAVAPAVHERRAPITLVSGPSASSDIELSRVEGVHGPRHLLVLIAG